MDIVHRFSLQLRRRLGINVQSKHLVIGAVCVLVLVWWVTRGSGSARGAQSARAKHFSPVTIENGEFRKNGQTFRILSGSIHYFRVPPKYWRDRLLKLKAAGLNTVDTYVPWNMHEPTPGSFDFTGILDVREFLSLAKSMGLHAIVRPGPYICAEWELGGLPAWLLHDRNMKLRSIYPPFLVAVARYFDHLFAVLNPLQATHGGPIIALQVENEYLSFGKDQDYMLEMYNMMRHKGVKELLFTSDGVDHLDKAIAMLPDDVLVTVNFQEDPDAALAKLKKLQPHKPLFVAEFWTGWFLHWREKKPARTLTPPRFKDHITRIIQKGASFNLYMFHGGTTFGFMNGANIGDGKQYEPDITSYDYDAPINEFGKPTMKYMALREVLPSLLPEFVQSPLPPIPDTLEAVVTYGDIHLTLALPLLDCLPYLPQPESSVQPVPMEMLSVNNGAGQSYGFVMYRTSAAKDAKKVGIRGLKDFGVALINGFSFKTLSWYDEQTFPITKPAELLQQMTQEIVNEEDTLDILVENMGRVNFVTLGDKIPLELLARKGVTGSVAIDGHVKNDWKIYSFEFPPAFMKSIELGGRWQRSDRYKFNSPTIYKGSFTLEQMPEDTFADMSNWGKGVLFINNVNLGRYWQVGPQKTLYIPSSVLHRGINKIMVVELIHPSVTTLVPLVDKPIL